MSSESDYRQRAARADVSLLGTVTDSTGQAHPIVVLSLSSSGVMIQTHEAPAEGESYALGFTVHSKAYDVRIEVVGSLHEAQKDTWGWRCRFIDVGTEEAQALERAVLAAIGQSTHATRTWAELETESREVPEGNVVLGQTPAGRDIVVLGKDVLEMGPEGVELFVQMLAELERM
ncbi:MAG: PilZ domain-containing protein [Chloroflexi bacterium]|nr:PilZ domain-containing protein [Chloroflexota bacterium]